MAWTTPGTAVTGATATAAFWNANVRDNMLETAAATAAAAGDVVYADAANSMGTRLAHPGATGYLLASNGASGLAWRQVAEDVDYQLGAVSDIFTNTTYAAIDPVSGTDTLPTVTVTTGTLAIVWISCGAASNNTAGATVVISYSVSGATTVAASDNSNAVHESGNANDNGSLMAVRLQTLTAGSNTFQMQAKVSNGTGTILRPRILVMAL